MDLKGREITLLGAGIGGLTAALALARRGAQVRVLEQAAELAEVGAGIQISQNGMVVLRTLDVFGDIPGGAVRSDGVELRDYKAGRAVTRLPPPKAGPTWYFHRADLLASLEAAARGAGVRIELGQQVVGLEQVGETVTVKLVDGSRIESPLVIGADGVRGVSRGFVCGDQQARFSGQAAWRAIVPATGGEPARAVLTMAPGRHVVTYPLRDGAWMNIVAVEDRRDWRQESWRAEGDVADFHARFCNFGGDVGELLRRVEQVHLWGLHLHPVAKSWNRGQVALLGDAAHPTLPFMAQGACLAIEDAWVLARTLTEGGLARYEAERIDRARRVVAAARGNTWKFHAPSPFREIGQIALRLGGEKLAPRFEWIYSADVTA